MTLSELHTVLKATGLPVAYAYFPDDERPGLPIITYEVAYTTNFGADNKVFSPFTHVDIFLFQREKGSAESSLEAVLEANTLFWDKTETYLNDEKVYQSIYEVTINAS